MVIISVANISRLVSRVFDFRLRLTVVLVIQGVFSVCFSFSWYSNFPLPLVVLDDAAQQIYRFQTYLLFINSQVMRIGKNLRNYIKAEEKDIMHTVNHYSHVMATDPAEATRIHPHVLQHLKLCQQRMEQSLEMLQRYPDVEKKVRPEIGMWTLYVLLCFV